MNYYSRHIKNLFLLIVGVVCMGFFAGCGDESSTTTSVSKPTETIEGVDLNHMSPKLKEIYDRGTIIVGNDSSYPPFGFIDPSTNQATGVEKEMAGKIAEKLSAVLGKSIKLEFESMNFDAVMSSLATGKIDLVCSAVSITDERKQSMDFSKPYLNTKDLFLFNKSDAGKYTSLDSFKNIKIAANSGSAQEVRARTLSNDITSTPTIADGILQLKSGKVDAVIVDNITGLRYQKTNDDLGSYEISDSEIKPAEKGVALQKNSPDLLAIVNAVVDEQVKAGNVDKWINDYTDKAINMGLN